MTIRKPAPLPDQRAVWMLPDGRPSPDAYRWYRSMEESARETVDFANTPVPPPPPDPEYELIEEWPIYIQFPEDGDITLILDSEVERVFFETVSQTVAGTCTVTFKVNSTSLGGAANSASATMQGQAHASSNVLEAGDNLVITISDTLDCEGLALNAKSRRILTSL